MFTKDLYEKIDALGTIRSVQSGTYSAVASSTFTTALNKINPSKCEVILNGQNYYKAQDSGNGWAYAYAYNRDPYIVSLTENQLTIQVSGSTDYKASGSWQVIEFY